MQSTQTTSILYTMRILILNISLFERAISLLTSFMILKAQIYSTSINQYFSQLIVRRNTKSFKLHKARSHWINSSPDASSFFTPIIPTITTPSFCQDRLEVPLAPKHIQSNSTPVEFQRHTSARKFPHSHTTPDRNLQIPGRGLQSSL